MAARACILGCLGPRLSPDEAAWFRDADPWGFIIFARNIETPEQVRALTAELRETVGRDAPVLVDQEGGRVARFRAPHWHEVPPALDFCQAAGGRAAEGMRLRGRLIAHDLQGVGVDVNCAPMLDVATEASHQFIRNRCYGTDPETVAANGRALADGMQAGGVLPIIKHIPGHGRAQLDSHFELPRLDTPLAELQATDFAPFRALSDLPMAMTAHIIYAALDPDACATLSEPVIRAMRKDMGFGGLLMTDDLSMKALTGSFAQRAETALAAGCDVLLHCNGDKAEMDEILSATPRLSGDAAARASAALAARTQPDGFDPAQAVATLNTIMKDAAHV